MEKLEITDKQLQSLTPKADIYNKSFGDGFNIRVFPDGRRIATYSYQLLGKRRVLQLGVYGKGEGKKTLTQLKKAHTAAKVMKTDGTAPASQREQAKTAVIKERHEQAKESNISRRRS